MTERTNEPRNIAGQVVRGPDFWGRDVEVAELWRRLERGSVLLAAPRRHGKSSLMYALADAPQPGWQVVLLNVEYVETPAEFANEIAARVFAAHPTRNLADRIAAGPRILAKWFAGLVESVDVGVPDVAEVKVALRAQAPVDWRAALEAFWRVATANSRLLLVLDELPVMVAGMLEKDEAEAVRFLHWFRALRQEGGRFLLGGSVNMEPLLHARGQSALLNDLDRMWLPAFSPERRVAFLQALLAGEGYPVTDAGLATYIAEKIDSGVPYYLQVYLDEILAEARRCGCVPNRELADRALADAVLGPRCFSRFSHYLERLRAYGTAETAARELLHRLAETITLTDLPKDDATMRLLTRLHSDWYIEREGAEVRFADGFLKAWWRRNAPMGRLR